MQTELIEKIIHLPISERIEIIERVSRSVREDLQASRAEIVSVDERKSAVDRLRGIAAVNGKVPPGDEEVEEDYADYLAEKYK